MASCVGAFAACLSFISLVLVAIAMATNFWLRADSTATLPELALNPPEANDDLSGLKIAYRLEYFGLWVGCHRETSFAKISCGYIDASCKSNICWIRNSKDEACKLARVRPINNCPAYQAVRAMTIIGTIFLILGSSILVVSICVPSRTLSTLGALSTFVAAFFLMIAFAVFYDRTFKYLDAIAHMGWSFILLIVAWPLAVFASLAGLAASIQTPKQEPDFEVSE